MVKCSFSEAELQRIGTSWCLVEVYEEGDHDLGFPLSLIWAKAALKGHVLYHHLPDSTAVHGILLPHGICCAHALCVAGQAGEGGSVDGGCHDLSQSLLSKVLPFCARSWSTNP